MADTSATDYSTSTVINAASRFGGSNPPGPPLNPPGGGGTYDGMEARVARLEADVGHIQRDVVEIKGDVKGVGQNVTDLLIDQATLTERVSHLLTTGKAVAMLSTMLVLIAALVAFQGQIQKFVGASSSAPSVIVPPVPAKK